MLNKTTYIAEDGGCSGWTAFFTLGWSDNNNSDTINHKEFELSIDLTNWRTSGQMWSRKKTLIADWKSTVDNELNEYNAENYQEYKEKVKEAKEKKNKSTNPENQEKELVKENPYNPNEGEYAKLLEEVKELKKNQSKPLELKEKDMKAIMERVDAKSKEEIERINNQVEKQEEQNTKVAQEIKIAQAQGNKQMEAKLMTILNQGKAEAAKLNAGKKEVITPEVFQQMFQDLQKEEMDKSWQFDWKSKRTWSFAALFLILLFIIFLIFVWIWSKIKTLFFSKQ